jgi:predicted dehydrogenase
MRKIAIVGAGGIGQRHAQSCAMLSATEYHLHIVEPNEDNKARTSGLLDGRQGVTWHKSVSDLPQSLDLAIVATRADIRAAIVRTLIEDKSSRSLILEKVLFQKIAEYETTAQALTRAGAASWVNCARRMWPAYRQLRNRLKDVAISGIEISGANWDIGCNAIHFIDLMAFLTGADQVVVDDVKLGDVRVAKRAGMLHIEGIVSGHVIQGATRVPFNVASAPAHSGPQMIKISTAQGMVEILESATVTAMVWPGEAKIEAAIPFQSELTASAVQTILASGQCDLATYDESRALHETFVAALLRALDRAGQLADREICPIT